MKRNLFAISLLLLLAACQPNEQYFGITSLDNRGILYFSEIHWSGSVDDTGTYVNSDDDFIELRSWYKGDLDISGWTILVRGSSYHIITIPEGTVISTKEYYSIGNNTNGAFTHFDLVDPAFSLPAGDFDLDIYDGGGGKHADSADFTAEIEMPAGYDLPALKKSAVRMTDYFGPKDNLECWANYNSQSTGTYVRTGYRNSVFASPGESLGEVGETSDYE